MKTNFLILFFNVLSLLICAQGKTVQQWKDTEKKFLIYLNREDFDKAEIYLKSMQKIAFSKFKAQDTLYAITIHAEASLISSRKCYLDLYQLMNKHIQWLRLAGNNGIKLDLRHYNYLLVKANTAFNLADSYMFNKKLLCTDTIIPNDNLNRYQRALSYFDSAAVYYQELKNYVPDHPDVLNNLAITYRMKGLLFGQFLGNLESCITALEQSVRFKEDTETYRLLGVANGISGNHFVAIHHFEKALEIGGDRQAAVLYSLEVAYRQLAANALTEKEALEYQSKADSYQIIWKTVDPNFNPNSGN